MEAIKSILLNFNNSDVNIRGTAETHLEEYLASSGNYALLFLRFGVLILSVMRFVCSHSAMSVNTLTGGQSTGDIVHIFTDQ